MKEYYHIEVREGSGEKKQIIKKCMRQAKL